MVKPITVAMMKINMTDDEVRFQLAAVDLHSSTLMLRNPCDRHGILKGNS